jgi:hypothetical protein
VASSRGPCDFAARPGPRRFPQGTQPLPSRSRSLPRASCRNRGRCSRRLRRLSRIRGSTRVHHPSDVLAAPAFDSRWDGCAPSLAKVWHRRDRRPAALAGAVVALEALLAVSLHRRVGRPTRRTQTTCSASCRWARETTSPAHSSMTAVMVTPSSCVLRDRRPRRVSFAGRRAGTPPACSESSESISLRYPR